MGARLEDPYADRPDQIFRVGEIEVNLDRHTVQVGGQLVYFAHREFRLLAALLRAHGRILTRTDLEEAIYDYDWEQTPWSDTAIRVQISTMRKKLGSEGWRIQNVAKHGYRLVTEEREGSHG
jgi:two-component system, OmpR family, alkaline phosphatase synthesis response regulator PhoP